MLNGLQCIIECFTWRHGGHAGVSKQRNGGYAPGIELYSSAKIFFCFGGKNILIDHVSENTL